MYEMMIVNAYVGCFLQIHTTETNIIKNILPVFPSFDIFLFLVHCIRSRCLCLAQLNTARICVEKRHSIYKHVQRTRDRGEHKRRKFQRTNSSSINKAGSLKIAHCTSTTYKGVLAYISDQFTM